MSKVSVRFFARYAELAGCSASAVNVPTPSTVADVIVRWADSVPPDAPPDNGPPVKACGGVTQGVLGRLCP